jgi:hypothetical protein
MNRARTHRFSDAHGWRLVLAVCSGSLLAGSLAFLIATAHPHARARVRKSSGSGGVQSIGGLAAQVQASIAGERQLESERATQVDRHALRDPDDQLPRPEARTIASAERVVRRWLAGYLPYEVDQLGRLQRLDLTTTSTAPLARSLLSNEPLIPPTQQQNRPPRGHLLGLQGSVATGGRSVGMYVEVAYGLEQQGFHLTLTRGAHGWLVAAFHG